jgi:hypothetical protein
MIIQQHFFLNIDAGNFLHRSLIHIIRQFGIDAISDHLLDFIPALQDIDEFGWSTPACLIAKRAKAEEQHKDKYRAQILQ